MVAARRGHPGDWGPVVPRHAQPPSSAADPTADDATRAAATPAADNAAHAAAAPEDACRAATTTKSEDAVEADAVPAFAVALEDAAISAVPRGNPHRDAIGTCFTPPDPPKLVKCEPIKKGEMCRVTSVLPYVYVPSIAITLSPARNTVPFWSTE